MKPIGTKSAAAIGLVAAVVAVVVAILGPRPAPTDVPPREVTPGGGAGGLRADNHLADLGVVVPGTERPIRFRVTNTGVAPVAVLDLRTSCGCSPASMATRTLAPGGSAEVTVKFQSPARIGEVTHQVTLTTDSPATPEVRLTFRAVVDWPVEVSPAVLDYGHVAPSGDAERTVKLVCPKGGPFRVESSRTAGAGLTLEKIDGADSDTCHRYKVTLAAGTESGDYRGAIRFVTSHPDRPSIDVEVRARVEGTVRVSPPRLVLAASPPGGEVDGRLLIAGGGGEVSEVTVEGAGWAAVSFRAVPAGGAARLDVKLVVPDEPGYHRATMTVRFGDDRIDVPVSCLVRG